jgi:Zn-dependent protease
LHARGNLTLVHLDQSQPNDPPGQKAHSHGLAGLWKRLAAPVVAAFVLLAKAKGLLLLLVHVPALSFIATLGLSLWLYVVAFGWSFALVLLIVLVTHEFGHYAAFRAYGLPVRLPNFVPFLGAFTMGTVPDDIEHDAYIALAGPLTGLVLAAACASIATMSSDPSWIATAYFSGIINLFNMIPFSPLDGGRVVRGIFPSATDPRSATHDTAARLRVAGAYAGTALALLWVVIEFHHSIVRPA